MADAVAIRSTPERPRVHPEMMLALQTAIAARAWVDRWARKDTRRRPYNASNERSGRKHRAFTARLREVMEILRSDYERWFDHAGASLQGVAEQIWSVHDEGELDLV